MADDLIRNIHSSGGSGVVVVTGGGAAAISRLLAVPGGSRSLLEASVPYSSAALAAWLKRKPETYCSEETALAMAAVAHERAKFLSAAEADSGETPRTELFGLSCSASLVSDRPKKGAHRAHVAVHTSRGTASYSLTLDKGARDRRAEEELVADLIVNALATTCGIRDLPPLSLRPGEQVVTEAIDANPLLVDLLAGSRKLVWSLPDGSYASELPANVWPEGNSPKEPRRGVLCGAFNPLHAGHTQLRDVAAKRLVGPVYFEISLRNVDKPPLDFLTLERRRRQFTREPLALTSAPTFAEKSLALPNTTFVVGLDTAERIVEWKYYDDTEAGRDRALQTIRDQGCRFLVAGRLEADGCFRTLSQASLPPSAANLFDAIPETEFRVDLSSTELRRDQASRES